MFGNKGNLKSIGISSLIASLILAFGAPSVLAASTMQNILDAKNLRVCVWAPYFGITSNDSNGNWQGVDIEMADALAGSLGAKTQFVESSFGAFATQLADGECHIAMFGIGRTFTRAQKVTFSEPYMASGLHAVVNSSKTSITFWKELDIKGNTIAVTKNTFVEAFMSNYLKQATMLPISPSEWIDALNNGQADALVTDFVFATKLKKTTDWAVIVSPEQDLSHTTYGYATAPESQHFLGYVNLFVSEAKRNGMLRSIAEKHELDHILYEQLAEINFEFKAWANHTYMALPKL